MKKILFVTAHSYDQFPINANQEYITIMEEKSKALLGASFHVVSLPNPSKDVLLNWLESEQPYILHFAGHGNNKGEPILYDKFYIEAGSFSTVLKRIKSVECLFLNSCKSYEFIQELNPYTRLAVGMEGYVPVDGAIQFAGNFYKYLFAGNPIYAAFVKAFDNYLFYKEKKYEPMLQVNLDMPIENTQSIEWLKELPSDFNDRLAAIQKTIDDKGNSLSGRILQKHPFRTVVEWFVSNKKELAQAIANKVFKHNDLNAKEDLFWDLEVYFKLLDPLVMSLRGKELLKPEAVTKVKKTQKPEAYIQSFEELILLAKAQHVSLPEDCYYFEERVRYFITLFIG